MLERAEPQQIVQTEKRGHIEIRIPKYYNRCVSTLQIRHPELFGRRQNIAFRTVVTAYRFDRNGLLHSDTEDVILSGTKSNSSLTYV